MNVIQKMLRDYYEIIEYDIKPRPVVMENIDKVINCGDPSYGGAMYGCPHCGNLKFVPFRCHSKFCPSCGAKYSNDRSTAMSFKLIQCTHRHLVFTIDESLRRFFLEDRTLLNCLFEAVSDVIKEYFFSLTNPKTLSLGLSVSFIPSVALSVGIHTSTVSLPKVGFLMMVSGARSHISIIPTSVNPFRLFC